MIEASAEPVHDDLVRAGVLAPVALGSPEERAWLDCDLASLAEHRIGDLLDPRELDDARRAMWLSRVVDERPMSLARRTKYERCYWLLDAGKRAGTMALSTTTLGGMSLHLASLYVLPPFRGRGVGRGAMLRVMEVLRRHNLGLRLETAWCWQRTVRFYVKLGLWVYMWKRDLTLCWDAETPAPQLEIGEETASLSVPLGYTEVTLARAHRRGDALVLEDPPPELAKEKALGEAYWHAASTLALSLAMHGWPLLRSAEAWEEARYADGGAPEALAYKITVWEAWCQKHGWRAETPRIPGLEYPTWDALEARWEEENRAYLAREQK